MLIGAERSGNSALCDAYGGVKPFHEALGKAVFVEDWRTPRERQADLYNRERPQTHIADRQTHKEHTDKQQQAQ